MSKHKSIPEKMQKHSELITNSINDPEISDEVADFGYTREKLNEGNTLLEETTVLIVKQGDEYADQKHADGDFMSLRSSLETRFTKDKKLAKIALEDEPILLKVNLGVNSYPAENYPEWMSELNLFYNNALKSSEIMGAFAELNITAEKLKAQQRDIATLKTLKLNQKKEMGEAQVATKVRDKKIAELDKWAKKYKKVATIVFEDQPQVLEKLGILVRS